MDIKKTLAATMVSLTGLVAWSSGFGLYEPSAKYHALGGAVVGKAVDASANFANPATLTDLTNFEVTVGFVTEHPRGTVDISRNNSDLGEYKMDPGLFWLPHLMLAAPLPYDFTFGLGISAEYGLGTRYPDNWPMKWSCTETTVQGLVINPNLAYKITDKWSVAAGLRWLYFDFEQYRDMTVPVYYHPLTGKPLYYGYNQYRLKGDNGWDGFGWQIGTKYDILDNLSVGLMYKAQIETTIEGQTTATPHDYTSKFDTGLAQGLTGAADADITLPQSVTFGVNYDPYEDWHVGLAFSWTEWSQFDQLIFNIPQGNPFVKEATPTTLNWKDTWRGSLGVAWDFADDWTWMVSYTYDMDSTSCDQASAMLPPASRHIVATGFSWYIGCGFEATLSYSCIFMNGFDMYATDSKGGTGRYNLETERGFCHAGGFSITYRF